MDEPLFNPLFPKSSKLARWALSRAKETVLGDPIEYEGSLYVANSRIFKGAIGSKLAPILQEIGVGRVFLVNEELRQVWIEKLGHYVSDYGRFAVGEVRYEKINAAEKYAFDSYDSMTRDPDSHIAVLKVFSNFVEQGKRGYSLFHEIKNTISVAGAQFEQAKYLMALEIGSRSWAAEELTEGKRLQLCELTENIQKADPIFNLKQITAGYDNLLVELSNNESGMVCEAKETKDNGLEI